jgi:ketosteroid isomerase-like protein
VSEKIELVREGLAAFTRGEFERLAEFVQPDMVSFRASPLPGPQTYHGAAGVLEMYDDWTAEFEDFEMEFVEFAEVGDRVVVEMVQRATGKASGLTVEAPFWMVYTLRQGKISRLDVYNSREQALEAASPPP